MPGFSFFHHKDSQEVDSANTFTVDEEEMVDVVENREENFEN